MKKQKGQAVILKKLDIVAELHKVKGGVDTRTDSTGTTVGTVTVRGDGPVCW